MNILVCDDDKEIVRAIEIYLTNEGYDVIKAYDGFEAIEVVRENDIQLVLMDIMMPRMDGIQATEMIRKEKNIPIIMLSAKSEDYDKVSGLNTGADDYITKPFSPPELIARVKSHLRRYVDLGSMEKNDDDKKIYHTGGLAIDDSEKTVTVDGKEISVTPTEFGILSLLVKNAGRVFSMEQIYEAVWNEEAFNPENTVAVHIRHIREKIEVNPKNPQYLKVVWGIGYKIERIDE